MLEAFRIFKKYDNDNIHHAQHDEVFAGPNPDLVSEEDNAVLEALGWLPVDDCYRLFP